MAYTFTLNLNPVLAGEAFWNLKEALVAGGWDVASSGDGTAFSASGDVHDPGGPYDGTMDNTNAWMRLRAPAAMSPRREFVLHHDIADTGHMTTLYSSDGTGFTGGTPSATVRPTAADEVVITSNTANFWSPTQQRHRQDILVGDADENFCFFEGGRIMNGSEANLGYNHVLYLDVLDGAHASDPDPAVVGCVFSSDGSAGRFALVGANPIDIGQTSSATNVGSSRGWYDKGVTDVWVNYPMTFLAGEGGAGHILRVVEGAGLNAVGELEENVIWYWRGSVATQPGRKGYSHLFKTNRTSTRPFRPSGGTTPLTKMNLSAISMPWDGVTNPFW
jgi:hypothetical protein